MTSIHRVARSLESLRASETASAVVEMAVVIPVLLLIGIGVGDYARAYATGIAVANAAKAGAQFGAQSTATSGDTAAINNAARQDGLDAGAVTVTSSRVCRCADGAVVNCVTGNCASYGVPRVYIAVTATRNVTTIFNYPGLPASIPISRTATLRLQ